MRPRIESNYRIEALRASALPLGYLAEAYILKITFSDTFFNGSSAPKKEFRNPRAFPPRPFLPAGNSRGFANPIPRYIASQNRVRILC